jgi:phage shock protein PspC (stress-responsive transcriptional regulator)
VSAGLASTFGFSTALLRLALAAAALVFGLIIVIAYLALWFFMPEDPSIPAERRPGLPPLSLVVIVALIYVVSSLFRLTLGLVSLAASILPVVLLVGAVVALVTVWRRSSRSRHALQ